MIERLNECQFDRGASLGLDLPGQFLSRVSPDLGQGGMITRHSRQFARGYRIVHRGDDFVQPLTVRGLFAPDASPVQFMNCQPSYAVATVSFAVKPLDPFCRNLFVGLRPESVYEWSIGAGADPLCDSSLHRSKTASNQPSNHIRWDFPAAMNCCDGDDG